MIPCDVVGELVGDIEDGDAVSAGECRDTGSGAAVSGRDAGSRVKPEVDLTK